MKPEAVYGELSGVTFASHRSKLKGTYGERGSNALAVASYSGECDGMSELACSELVKKEEKEQQSFRRRLQQGACEQNKAPYDS
jgi:hypothetical protein